MSADSPADTTRVTAHEFDQIAPVYDESRGPMPPEVLERLAAVLGGRGVRTLLEVGVGTGRVARPLSDRGFRVTGLDASRAMMARARTKGFHRLVQGSAYALPFRDGSFDGTLFVHVLHTLSEPAEALREAMRAGHGTAMALLAERQGPSAHSGPGPNPHEVLREAFREAGVERSPRRRPFEKEREIVRLFPPAETVAIGERSVVEPFERRLSWIEHRADRATLRLPESVVREVVRKTRERIGDATVTVRTSYRLAVWTGEIAPIAAP
jgi:SAM-dependent methyltransferase